ncbi:MAG: DUF885 domain-containing protein [Vicinamibacteraceae bacterium]
MAISRQPRRRAAALFAAAAIAGGHASLLAQAPPAPAAAAPRALPAWVIKSNELAKIWLDAQARLSPEGAGQMGLDGYDELITDLSPGYQDRARTIVEGAVATLKTKLAAETDPQVKQDLAIMVKDAVDTLDGFAIEQKHFVPYFNVAGGVFGGLRGLLDDQMAPARRPAALARLKKYVGVGYPAGPYTTLAEAETRSRLNQPGLLFPAKAAVERSLADSAAFIDGIPALFDKYGITGYEQDFALLKTQLAAYDAFVKETVLPKARTDFRLPAEVYARNLRQYGVDIPPAQLAKMAHQAFDAIQKDMNALAPEIAKAKGWTVTDYRDVIRELKKQQLVGDAILPHYQSRLKDLETIITREKLVTLPSRPARIRLASAAETAASPAPNMRPPRLVGNTGEQGEFVLPLNVPSTDGTTLKSDDFTFEAASWTLTAHEARPGHEMQFAGIVEAGVSTARVLFSFNSTNVEGWGLYSEKIVQPFMPADGRLISLQHRLMRAARAFLDPELQAGTITPEQAGKVLSEQVVLSPAMVRQEVDRYTFRGPGQATSYFYGYTRLLELRAAVEKALGPKFDQKAFHDAILAQGLLPPDLMRDAIMKHFGVR